MKIIYVVLLVVGSFSAKAQSGVGEPHTEAVSADNVPPSVQQQLRKLAPNFDEASWEHYYCQQCGKDGTYSYYKADFFQEEKPANLTINEDGRVLAFQLRTKLSELPGPAQQVVTKRASKMQQDYKGIELELYSFTAGDQVLYNIVFYIPTEDKKHWTPYDEINVNAKGSLVKKPN